MCIDAFLFARKMKPERTVCVFVAFLCIRNVTTKIKVFIINIFAYVEHDVGKKNNAYESLWMIPEIFCFLRHIMMIHGIEKRNRLLNFKLQNSRAIERRSNPRWSPHGKSLII